MSRLTRLLGLEDRIERRVLNGRTIKPKNDRPTILFFSIHKAASSYVNEVLRKVLLSGRYVCVDLENYAFQSLRARPEILDRHIQPTGLYYGSLRSYVDVSPAKKTKMIIQVRDPRDAITSEYFSYSLSHRPPVDPERLQVFKKARQHVRKMDIDRYAREANDSLFQTLEQYSQAVFRRDDVLVLHYEDMVLQFEDWLNSIIQFIDLPESVRTSKALQSIRDAADFRVKEEKKSQHKRQVTPGDHARKLKPVTVQKLNQVYGPYFQVLAETGNLPQSYEYPGFETLRQQSA